jgi:hypothetical protein
MTSARTKPGVAFWATVVVVVALVAYPLSFGPACWINNRTGLGDGILCISVKTVTPTTTCSTGIRNGERSTGRH